MDEKKTVSNLEVNEEVSLLEEISLKELLEVLLKGKFIIVIITVVALVCGVVAYKVLPDQYKSTVSILANPIVQNQASNYTNKLVLPDMDIVAYEQQFLNNYTVRQTIEELDLRDNNGKYLTYENFENKVKITNPTNTNILEIDVTDRDPEMAARIANTLAKHFTNYITDIYQTSAVVSLDAISDQLKIEEANLDEKAAALRDYLTSSDNLDALNGEISTLISQLTGYKARINDLQNAIAANKSTLETLKAATSLGDLDTGVIDMNTIFDAYGNVQNQLQINLNDNNEIEKALLTIKITNLQTALLENINEEAILGTKVREMEDRLSSLQAKNAEEQYRYNAVLRDYNHADSIYETYRSQYREALIVQASNVGNVTIKITSGAVAPEYPDNKSLMLTGAISVVLGLFIGVFLVFFRHYWASTPSSYNTSKLSAGINS